MIINIIGRGNVATHLYRAFSSHNHVNMVNPHTLEGLDSSADITIISVSDSAIRSVIDRLPSLTGILAHTSGSIGIDVFRGSGVEERSGVFYPLQTFTKNKPLDYSEIPFFIEGTSSEVEERLKTIASKISDKVYCADSEERKKLHIGAVFACNFVNHLFTLSSSFLKKNNLDFEVLRPLIGECVKKINTVDPFDAQTGPAVRGDSNVIDSHLQILHDEPELAEIYRILSHSIMERHHKGDRVC